MSNEWNGKNPYRGGKNQVKISFSISTANLAAALFLYECFLSDSKEGS